MSAMDMVGTEISRVRGMLDNSKTLDVEVYRVLDALWQVTYTMWLEAMGVIKSPGEQKVIQVDPKTLASMLEKHQKDSKTTTIADVMKNKEDGYL